MTNLKRSELILIQGGGDAPTVSDDPRVQAGHSVGWYVGRAIGATIRQVKSIFDIF